uniref:Uncharacterized protein n=1 Tax=Schistosoma haematobium TaxID=6185 RepID=A0A094ZEV9_SCHHA
MKILEQKNNILTILDGQLSNSPSISARPTVGSRSSWLQLNTLDSDTQTDLQSKLLPYFLPSLSGSRFKK